MFWNSSPWEKTDLLREIQATLILCAAIFLLPSASKILFPALSGPSHLLIASSLSLLALLFLKPGEIGIRPLVPADLLFVCAAVLTLGGLSPLLTDCWRKVLTFFSLAPDSQKILDEVSRMGPADLLATLFSTCICTPIAEELLFRRLFYGFLRKIGSFPAVLLSAVIFAAAHFFLLGLPVLILYGMVFQMLFSLRKNLAVPILTHFLLNAAAISVTICGK